MDCPERIQQQNLDFACCWQRAPPSHELQMQMQILVCREWYLHWDADQEARHQGGRPASRLPWTFCANARCGGGPSI